MAQPPAELDEIASRQGGRLQEPVLGIETSCDETAAALLSPDGTILAERLLSQTEEHAPFGGVVPEVAARSHLAHLPQMIRDVLAEAGVAADHLGAVAATVGPGLIGGLLVGAGIAKGIALGSGVPFVAVNHLAAHALSARLPGLPHPHVAPVFPYLLLLVSGGHTQLVLVQGVARFRRIGTTIDDAAGEAFDKSAKLLGLGWPGGPALERLAAAGDPRAVRLPRPMAGREGFDFSFSGLKTAVANEVARFPPGPLPEAAAADLAASFQAAASEALADRARRAMAWFRAELPAADRVLVVAGGVAANGAVRRALADAASREGFTVLAPPLRLCTDNAVMVAWAAIERLRDGRAAAVFNADGLDADGLDADGLDTPCRPRWPLDSLG